nr:hypothetical protein [Tanacetum cinerariifolium]
MSDLLKTYQHPTHTIPMLNKRPMLGINDLHKTALGRKNPKPSSVALDSHPALYNANVLFTPSDDKLITWETEDDKPYRIRDCCWSHTKTCVEEQVMAFVTQIKKFTYDFGDICSNDITEFEQVFDNLDAEYDEGVKTIKGLKITNRSLVKDVEFLISDSIANDVFTLAVNHMCMENDKRMPVDSKENTNCVRENGPTVGDCVRHALETEITQLKDSITSLNIQLNAYKIENKSLS